MIKGKILAYFSATGLVLYWDEFEIECIGKLFWTLGTAPAEDSRYTEKESNGMVMGGSVLENLFKRFNSSSSCSEILLVAVSFHPSK